MNKKSPYYLNLGCGDVFSHSPQWINVDISPADPRYVQQYQLRIGIPFPDDIFSAVYHADLLGCFPHRMVKDFLRECLRVLVPGGVLRVSVPDLEQTAQAYLQALVAVRQGGGEPSELGLAEARSRLLRAVPAVEAALPLRNEEKGTAEEPCCWVYDSHELTSLLQAVGFENIVFTSCHTDAFEGFQPDCDDKGEARCGEYLYVEARKPEKAGGSGLRVALFSSSDRGGAGIAALRLQAGLRRAGVRAITYTQHKEGAQEHVFVLPPAGQDKVVPYGKAGAALSSMARACRLQAQGLAAYRNRPDNCEYFSISDGPSRLDQVPFLAETQLINFHWINSFLDIAQSSPFLRGKKIVWTLHDMNPLTGGCHHADDCEGFLQQCGDCPQLGTQENKDLSRQNWQLRSCIYRQLDITVVTPSQWLAKKVRQSSLMQRFPVYCIPNGVPLDVFRPMPGDGMKASLKIPATHKTLLFSAASVKNPRKGLRYLLEALQKIQHCPEAAALTLLVLGSGSEGLRQLPYPIKILGYMEDEAELARVYAAADAVVLPSLGENLPNVLTEALACGTPGVAFRLGGIPEILDHRETGYLAAPQDVDDLAAGLLWALRPAPLRSRLCRARAMECFDLRTMAERYSTLFERIVHTASVQDLFPGDVTDMS